MRWTRFWGKVALVAAAATMLAACTSGDDDDAAESTTTTAGAPTEEAPEVIGPAPGVTDDTIKVGVAYVDTDALAAVDLDFVTGDYVAVYQALADDINENGGIFGRQLELVFAPIDPTSPSPAEEACVRLTEDEDVFVVIGFFLTDAVICEVTTHQTAVVGGDMTPERLEQALAPWVSWTYDTDLPISALHTYDERGALDGTVAVFANSRDQGVLDNQVLPTLEELGVTPVEVGVVDAPPEDQAALGQNVQTIGERFASSGADTIVLVGNSSQDWAVNMSANTSYRPTLLWLDITGPQAFLVNSSTTDISILEGSLATGRFGPNQAVFETEAMQECVGRLADRGVDTPSPESVGDDDPQNMPFAAAFAACADLTLLQAWLEAAGENLNYGTLDAALDAGFEVTIPGDPTPRHFGPAPDADGDPPAYLFEWDTAAEDFVIIEE